MRVAAIDQGTTSTRCLVFEDGGAWRTAASVRHANYHPAAGWVEQDPEELLSNIRLVLGEAGSVDAIALANQGESCLAWDAKTGEALSPVIVWQDARTTGHLARLDKTAQEMSKSISGLPLDPYFSASKLAWLLKNVPGVARAHDRGTLRLGTTDAFFLDRLCGSFVTDIATASRTGLLDLQTGWWSTQLCAMHGVPIDCLPSIVSVNSDFGEVDGTPVKASIVDQQAALYGHNCRQVGDSKITFGTGAFFLSLTGTERPETVDLLPTVAWRRHNESTTFAIEGGVYDAGSALDWARRLGLYHAPDELNDFQGPTALSRGLMFVPALSGLAAPYWDRQAAPLFIGMDHSTGPRDMVRAVLEGVAMLSVGIIEAAAKAGAVGARISIDGGMSQSAYFAQFLADSSQREITVPPMHELSALGLAELCGVDASACRAGAKTYIPGGSVTRPHHERFAEAVARARHWRV